MDTLNKGFQNCTYYFDFSPPVAAMVPYRLVSMLLCLAAGLAISSLPTGPSRLLLSLLPARMDLVSLAQLYGSHGYTQHGRLQPAGGEDLNNFENNLRMFPVFCTFLF